jgi:hypothetical protein
MQISNIRISNFYFYFLKFQGEPLWDGDFPSGDQKSKKLTHIILQRKILTFSNPTFTTAQKQEKTHPMGFKNSQWTEPPSPHLKK